MDTNLINSVKATLYDRAANPLVGSYIASFLIYHYQIPLILLTSEGLQERQTELAFYFSTYESVLQTLGFYLWPLFIALTYIYGLPYLSYPVYEKVLKTQKLFKEIKQKIDDETPLTRQEARELRINSRMIAEKYEEHLKQKNEEIADNKRQIEDLQKRLKELQTGLENTAETGISDKKHMSVGRKSLPYSINPTRKSILAKDVKSDPAKAKQYLAQFGITEIFRKAALKADKNGYIDSWLIDEESLAYMKEIGLISNERKLTEFGNLVKSELI